MQLYKLLLFIVGYVIIIVEGPVERFINLSIHKGMNLRDLKSYSATKIQFKIPLHDFWAVRSIIKQTGCRVKILDKRGLPFIWSKIKKRKLLIVGGLLFVMSMYLLSSFVWFIDIYSHEELVYLEKREIIKIAYNSGLRPGIYKKNVNVQEIERKMISKIPELSWVGLEFQGTRVVIEVVERKLPSEDYQDKDPKHLIASKNGIIHEILVMMGQPLVKVGDTVEKEQILISGIILPLPQVEDKGSLEEMVPQGEIKQVRARGIVRAKVWYEGQGTANLQETITRRTGSTETVYYINLPNKKVVLKGSLNSQFISYETETTAKKVPDFRYLKIPIEIMKTTFYEIEIEEKLYQKEEAIALIRKKILESFNLPDDVKIVGQEAKLLVETDQKVVVKLVIETIEDIAKLSAVE